MKQLFVDYRDRRATESIPADGPGGGPDAILAQVEEFGFAVTDMPVDLGPTEAVAKVADDLGLGEPYVPALYRKPGAERFATEFADIRAQVGSDHPGFAVRSAQDLHVDGLLDGPEDVPTVIMYCVRAAESGGASRMFNAIGAFHELQGDDPDAAAALTRPGVQRRTSTIKGVRAHRDDPVFQLEPDGTIRTSYTDNALTSWHADPGEDEALARGLARMKQLSGPLTRYSAFFQLAPGQGVVLRNDRVAHGRSEYQDDPGRPRHLIRAIYGRAPR